MEAQKTVIDGFGFELQILPAWQHTEASLLLGQLLGGAIKPIAALFNTKDSNPNADMEIVGALIQVLRTSKVQDVMTLARMLLADCIISGDLGGATKLAKLMPIFDTVLRGRLMTIYKLIAWAMKVNFTGFFDDLKSALPVPSAPPPGVAPSGSTSPNPLAGTGPAAG